MYLAGNETACNLYLKKHPSSPLLSSTITPSSSPFKKTKTKETRVWAKTVICLLTTKTTGIFTAYTLNDLQDVLDKGFNEEGYSGNPFYQFKQMIIKEVLLSFGVSVFQGVTTLLCTQVTMTAIIRGALCTDSPEDERKGKLSLGCYNPPSKEINKEIEDNETKELMDRALDQAPKHYNKKNMNIHQSYYIKDKDGISTITKNFATKVVFYFATKLTKEKPYAVVDLPAITRTLHMLILYLQDPYFKAWQAHFIKTYPHLHCLILDKIFTLVVAFHEACMNPAIAQAAMQGIPSRSASAFNHTINPPFYPRFVRFRQKHAYW